MEYIALIGGTMTFITSVEAIAFVIKVILNRKNSIRFALDTFKTVMRQGNTASLLWKSDMR